MHSSPAKYTKQKKIPVSPELQHESLILDGPEIPYGSTLIFEFKIDGMTCVACSRTIESSMKKEFSERGLQEVQIALLTHKMRMVFDHQAFKHYQLTTDTIVEEVEMIGFGAELLEMIENNQNAILQANDFSDDEEAGRNLDSQRNRLVVQPNSIKICTLIIEGMTCASCQSTIESHLKSLDGVQDASISLLTHKGTVQYKPNIIGIRTLIEEVEQLGFGAKFEPRADKSDIRTIVNAAVNQYRKKFFICLALQIPVLILMWIVPYAKPEFVTMLNQANGVPLFVLLTAFFATIIQLFMGAQFYINSYKALRNKSANMDVLIMLGTTSAWLYAIVLIGVGYGHQDMHDQAMYEMQVKEHAHNFEISSVLITIILLGKYLESFSKKKTVDKLAQLASLKVTKANLIEQKNDELISLNAKDKEIEVELLQVNDLVKVYPGSVVPLDAVVVFGRGICNEAMLTGESLPMSKDISSKIYGGSTLIQGTIIAKVSKTAENSSINQIIKLVENAQNAKAPIQGVADTIAKYFVPIIILLSCITWLSWFAYAFSKEGIQNVKLHGQTRFQFAFSFGISTLVIACPCALGLATPTAVMVGTGVAATYGILIKGGDVLEKISSITTIVFDKTGTLTSGCPQVKDLISIKEHFKLEQAIEDKDLLLFFTYLCEKGSEHPLAKAVVKKIESIIPSKIIDLIPKYNTIEFKNRDGEGVVANVVEIETGNKFEILCGNDKLVNQYPVLFHDDEMKKNVQMLEEEGMTVIQVIVNNVPQLIVSLEELHISKPESKEVVNYLKNKMHLKVAMITGDNQHSAYKVARHLGIDQNDVTYKAYPADKKRVVEMFQANGEKVMFVGDGINDSPVLAQADVGVAINAGSDITVNAAGIVLMKDSLFDVVNAIRISKKSFRRIKINFVWAFLYNLLLVPVAMGALYPINGFRFDPMYAGGAMALSSISVVLSSLMLKIFKPLESLSKYHQHDNKSYKKGADSTDNSVVSTVPSEEMVSQANIH